MGKGRARPLLAWSSGGSPAGQGCCLSWRKPDAAFPRLSARMALWVGGPRRPSGSLSGARGPASLWGWGHAYIRLLRTVQESLWKVPGKAQNRSDGLWCPGSLESSMLLPKPLRPQKLLLLAWELIETSRGLQGPVSLWLSGCLSRGARAAAPGTGSPRVRHACFPRWQERLVLG